MYRKKALVTGADGFIGSHLVEHLLMEGYSVRAFVLYNSFNSFGWLESLPKEKLAEIEIVSGDIRDPHSIKAAMQGIEVVFHLAALIAIPYSYQSPDSYLDVNIRGTLNVLQAAKELGTKRVLVTSTSEVYGSAQFVPITEKHPLQGQSPYSASKIAADKMAESFYCSFNLPVTIVRPFNTFGPRQSARAVIPAVIAQLLSGQTEIKMGDTTPTRDFLFVRDTVRGFSVIAAAENCIGQELNLASEKEITIGGLAQTLIDYINPNARIITDPERARPEKSEVYRLLGSSEKLHLLTGWQPEYSFQQGLEETINWFREPGVLAKYKPQRNNV